MGKENRRNERERERRKDVDSYCGYDKEQHHSTLCQFAVRYIGGGVNLDRSNHQEVLERVQLAPSSTQVYIRCNREWAMVVIFYMVYFLKILSSLQINITHFCRWMHSLKLHCYCVPAGSTSTPVLIMERVVLGVLVLLPGTNVALI